MINLYIGNLPLELNTEDLKDFLQPYGKIADAKVMRDKETGASRGFGFVMASEEEALKLRHRVNDLPLGRKRLIVREARGKNANFTKPLRSKK